MNTPRLLLSLILWTLGCDSSTITHTSFPQVNKSDISTVIDAEGNRIHVFTSVDAEGNRIHVFTSVDPNTNEVQIFILSENHFKILLNETPTPAPISTVVVSSLRL